MYSTLHVVRQVLPRDTRLSESGNSKPYGLWVPPLRVYEYGPLSADREGGGPSVLGEEAALHVMGEQKASEKRRNPWTSKPRLV
jgi:hypothetical protein